MEDVKQASDLEVRIFPLLNGKIPTDLLSASYVIHKNGVVHVEKNLGSGVQYSGGVLKIFLSESDTAALAGQYLQECAVRDSDGIDFFPLHNQPINFTKTLIRI